MPGSEDDAVLDAWPRHRYIGRMHRRFLALLAVLACAPASASAQATDPEPRRRDLIARAEALQAHGDHAAAAAAAVEAGSIRWSPSLRMLAAQELAAADRPVEAQAHARQCLLGTEADRSLRFRVRIAATCRALLEQLEARIGRIRVLLPDERPRGLHITVNGRDIPRSDWETAFAVSEGPAELVATGDLIGELRVRLEVFPGTVTELPLRFSDAPPTPVSPGTATAPAPVPAPPR